MEWAVGYKADELRMEDGNVEAFIEQLLARPYFAVIKGSPTPMTN